MLSFDILTQIHFYLEKYHSLLPNKTEKSLVHADFDPANILVDQTHDSWKVTGILDWEFSFSGSPLLDVANMLRYAHQMPPEFENSFLQGLQSHGFKLPEGWRTTISLLNLISLLDYLTKTEPKHCPNRCLDICAVIKHNLHRLGDE